MMAGEWWEYPTAIRAAYALQLGLERGRRYSPAEMDDIVRSVGVDPAVHRRAAVRWLRENGVALVCEKHREHTAWWVEPSVEEADRYRQATASEALSRTTGVYRSLAAVSPQVDAALMALALSEGAAAGETTTEVLLRLGVPVAGTNGA